ncbi:hypothetical protein EDB84DRAFT_1441083 [Lactarius hengduanensis]|nr:hypothetical protein EDB84DRAFT_1441083 [Lactarius hengduanensis]
MVVNTLIVALSFQHRTLQPNAAAVAQRVNDGVGSCEWRHGARWDGGDRLVQQMAVDSPVGKGTWDHSGDVLEGKERDRSEERSVIEELSGQHPSTRDREKLTSAASGLPNCTLPTCPPNHRYVDRYTAIGVVGVVETGRLGVERKSGEDKSIVEIRIGKKTTTVEAINRPTAVMDSVALDRMQPKFKHVEDSTLESAPESKIAENFSSRLRSATLHDIIDWMNIGIPQTNRSKVGRTPFQAPIIPHPNAEVQYSDGPRVATTDRALTSFLRLRSYIFDLVTLDLHSLTNRGHFKGVSELLELIYGNDQKRAKVMLAHTEEEEEPRGLWWNTRITHNQLSSIM